MLALIGTVLVTSFLDSLNPSAIAQELLLLAIAPEKRDVWWFITGIAPANLALGLAIYLGIATIVTEVVSSQLVALYLEYAKLRGTMLISTFEQALGRLAAYVVPAVLGIVGIALLATASRGCWVRRTERLRISQPGAMPPCCTAPALPYP